MTIMKYKKGDTRRGCLPFVLPEGFRKCPQYFCGEVCDRMRKRRNLWERQELRKRNMSEVRIKIRKLQDNGSTFRANPETLYLGGIGSAQVDRLRFELP